MAEKRKQKRRSDDVRGDDNVIKRYEFLIQNARDIILTIRQRDRKILEANAAAIKAYQYSIDELRSMTIDDLEAAEMKAQTKPHLNQDFNHELFFETIHVRKNRETFPVKVSLQETMMGNEKILLSLVHDISERGQSHEAMRESANNLRALLNAVPESLLLLDKDGTILLANEMFAKRMRIGIDKIIGANYYDLLPADTAEERRRQAENVIQSMTPVRFEYILDKRCIDQVIYPVFDNKREVARLAFFGADISRRREMEKELETMALNDQLTGLYNRRGFFTLATRELKRAQRSQSSLLLFFIDVDGLKNINDHFGHEEGDRMLMATAKILTNTFRISDIISRIGGDEYAILVVDADEVLMEKLLLRLYRLINNFNARKTHISKLALSIGHSVYDPLKPATLDELISLADQGMYKMKKVKYHRT